MLYGIGKGAAKCTSAEEEDMDVDVSQSCSSDSSLTSGSGSFSGGVSNIHVNGQAVREKSRRSKVNRERVCNCEIM